MAERSVADKLALRASAQQGFERSLVLLGDVNNSTQRQGAELRVSRLLVQVGESPIALPHHYFEAAYQVPMWGARNEFYQDIALLQAEMGHDDRASDTARMTFQKPSFYIDLGKTTARFVNNPEPIFQEFWSRMRLRPGEISDAMQTGAYLAAEREVGVKIDRSRLDQFNIYGKGTSRRDFFVNTYNLRLAEAYATAGFPDVALEIWSGTSEDGLPNRTESLSRIAIAVAKSESDPFGLIADAVVKADALETVDRYHPAFAQVQIYSNLIRAAHIYGLGTDQLVDHAQELVLTEPSNLRTEADLALAQALISTGKDARSNIARGLEWSRDFFGSRDDQGYNIPLQMGTMEAVFRVQMQGEYFDDARATIANLVQLAGRDEDTDVNDFKADEAIYTATLARKEYQAGQTQAAR